MKRIEIPGYDTDGVILSSSIPTWFEYVDAISGSSQDEPGLETFVSGWSGYLPSSSLHCGIVDLSSNASPRYCHIACENPQTFTIFTGSTGAPFSGAFPIWLDFTDIANGEDVTPPTLTAITDYTFKFDLPSPPRYCRGTIYAGHNANPQYLKVIMDSNRATITNFDPPVNNDIYSNSYIYCDITDDSGEFDSIILLARFSGSKTECVYTSEEGFETGYAEYSATSSLSTGSRFAIRRDDGWHKKPYLVPFIYDEEGKLTP